MMTIIWAHENFLKFFFLVNTSKTMKMFEASMEGKGGLWKILVSLRNGTD